MFAGVAFVGQYASSLIHFSLGVEMFYKGGPKNYSKADWLFIGGVAALMLVAGMIGKVVDNSGVDDHVSEASVETLSAVKRAGYGGDDAQHVAEAAERLCRGSGDC